MTGIMLKNSKQVSCCKWTTKIGYRDYTTGLEKGSIVCKPYLHHQDVLIRKVQGLSIYSWG